jgi:hypothetical protein
MKTKDLSKFNSGSGYTIIETMVAISLFLVVIMYGTTALLNANLLHKKSGDMRSIIDNLSFIMEDMSKNLRVGYDYRCFEVGNNMPLAGDQSFGVPQDCEDGWAIAFENSNDADQSDSTNQWVYFITDGKIYKSTNSTEDYVELTTPEVEILQDASGFSVIGSDSDDDQQPFVIIKLNGRITLKNNVITPFSLQTSVSQRLIDN